MHSARRDPTTMTALHGEEQGKHDNARPDPHSRQLLRDHAGAAVQRLGARDHAAVDEEGRRTRDASARALVHVLLHGDLVSAAVDALLAGGNVEPDLLGRGRELLRAGLWRMGKERVVIGPELALLMGTLGRLMGLVRSRMKLVDGEVPKHKLRFVAVLGLELVSVEMGTGPPT